MTIPTAPFWICVEATHICSGVERNYCGPVTERILEKIDDFDEQFLQRILFPHRVTECKTERCEDIITVRISAVHPTGVPYSLRLRFRRVTEFQPLEEFLEEFPNLRPVYDVLADFLPENIAVIRQKLKLRETVRAFAIKRPPILYFQDVPPHPVTFAHELIHLARFERELDEEVYAHNLSGTVVFMAEKGIKANPFRLHDLTEEQVNSALMEVGIKSVEEFYEITRCIPHTHKITPDGLRRVAEWKDVLATFIAEVTAGIGYDTLCEQVLEKLLLLTTTQ